MFEKKVLIVLEIIINYLFVKDDVDFDTFITSNYSQNEVDIIKEVMYFYDKRRI